MLIDIIIVKITMCFRCATNSVKSLRELTYDLTVYRNEFEKEEFHNHMI